MALNNINLGTAANNGTGEDIRSGGGKINANFAFLDSNKTDKGNYSGTAGDLKTYVDTMLQGLKWKDSVLVATTVNIALTGEQTIDGVLTATSRVLVKEQTTKTENGIYLTGAGAWIRTTDADANTELTSATVSIEQGTTLAGDIFTCNTSPITLGTTDIEFVSVSRGTVVTDHNALSGKQGGTSGEYNHLTNAELNKVQALPASSEAAFTKNSAFNLPFGTTAGTVAQGDDSRILNGQAAFDALPSKETPAGAQAKADAKVEDLITDGVLDKAPSQNAVFDALAGKADAATVVNSVTGSAVDNTDPNNPIVNIPAGVQIIPEATFTGVMDLSDGNYRYYDEYESGVALGTLAVSGTLALGSQARIVVKGDLITTPTTFIPSTWRKSGNAINGTATKINELTAEVVKNNKINIVNRVFDYVDSQPPSAPANLTESSKTNTSATMSWSASTDNVGVVSYNIYKDAVFAKNVAGTTGSVTGLTAETAYSFTVSALDAVGNESIQSSALVITTNAAASSEPSSLTNLGIWFDGTDSSKMSLIGSNVQSWTDKASTFTANKRGTPEPVFNTDRVTFSTIQLEQDVANTVLTKTNDLHGFLVFKLTNLNQSCIVANSISSSDRFAIGYRNGHFGITIYNGTAHARKSVAFTDTAGFHKLEFKYISGVMTAYLDGVEMVGATEPISNLTKFDLGGTTTTSQGCEIKDFFSNIGAMTTQEESDMNSYILTKHGI